MNNKILKSLLGATCLSLAIIGSANAGGFSRGNADTDILFETGNFNSRASLTFVSPKREFTRHGNPALVGTDYADDYVVPSFAFKLNITDNVRCAATHVMNMGGSAVYAAPTLSGKLKEQFDTYETGLTCGIKLEAGKGNFWLLGGGFAERFDYLRENVVPIPGAPNAILDLEGAEYGYRIGAAYEIPEYALRAQLMYRSGTKYGADGTLTVPGALIGVPVAQVPLPAIGEGELPQSVELKLQSGIAPGWLAFGSVKWTDWSVTEQLIASAYHPVTGALVRREPNNYFWQDGWTVTGGVGHQFNERLSGLVSLTWDRGVGTGWDINTDSYTLAVGGSLKDNIGGELRFGLGLSYLSSGEETQYSLAVPPTDKSFGVNSAVDSGYAVAGSIGYSIKW